MQVGTGSRPCLRFTKSSVIPDCNGPGRYNATKQLHHQSNQAAAFLLNRECRAIPAEYCCSSTILQQSIGSLILSGKVSMSNKGKFCWVRFDVYILQRPIYDVNVLKPKKSNFTKPTEATSSIENCVLR